ncbi:MAG: S-layer homology domain-containing protein [Clostridia bacterium]|nr:S-layer homology domain-containing protein [Clostridia bacterium]
MKKLICAILAVFNIILNVAFAQVMPLNEKQKEELYNYGIMVGDENGNLRLGDTITRAESAKMICVAGNIQVEETYVEEEAFPDVKKDFWGYKYICALKREGIVVGDERGLFNPENEITNEEIIKMIVCLLGYDIGAEMRGGFPAGYTFYATQLGVTKDMMLGVNTAATRNDVGIMLCNALDIPLLLLNDEKKTSDNSVSYSVADGENGNSSLTLRKILTE